ncbi:unnamed protein product [Owenia fusiformis]|uniref:Uncharacterized protein n=1 Tax=Owenia fusiformis TaxID=6347 RepID=A0A8J1TEW8_OWEFU|nr:unnamed protein product [Owenia fusiformis]
MSNVRSARDSETGESRPEERATVRKGRYAGLIFIAGTFFLGSWLMPPIVFISMWERILYTLRCQVLSVGMLLAGVIVVMITRANTTAINPLSERGEQYVKLDNRYLQNTLEQLVLSILTQLFLATYLEDLWVIPVMTFLFVLGRISFWIGYKWMPLYRSFGFMLTLVPTTFAYAITLGVFLRNGATHGFTTMTSSRQGQEQHYNQQQQQRNIHY